MSARMYRSDLRKIAGYTVLLRQTVRCVEDSYLMEGYPSLVKGTVLKTVRSPCGAWVRTPHLPYRQSKDVKTRRTL